MSILSEKAASILGIAPPKHYKRASSYDPLTLKKSGSDGVPHQPRSYSFHPGLKRGKVIDKTVRVTAYIHVQYQHMHAVLYSVSS